MNHNHHDEMVKKKFQHERGNGRSHHWECENWMVMIVFGIVCYRHRDI